MFCLITSDFIIVFNGRFISPIQHFSFRLLVVGRNVGRVSSTRSTDGLLLPVMNEKRTLNLWPMDDGLVAMIFMRDESENQSKWNNKQTNDGI